MLYVIHGQDFFKARQKSADLVLNLLKKKPDASHFKMTSENFEKAKFQELMSSQGLFEKKYIVELVGVIEDGEFRDDIIDRLEECAACDHVFIFVEKKIDKETLKKIEKYASKIQEFTKSDVIQKDRGFFSLADAFGERDRHKLWSLYRQAVDQGAVLEEIHGILFWGLKNMIISSSVGESQSKLKPFVYKKALRFSRNFKKEELASLALRLANIYHDSHMGKCDLELGLERLILKL